MSWPLVWATGSGAPHQVHDCVDFIVTVQDVCEQLVQVCHVRDRVVLGVTDPLCEVAEDVGFGEEMLFPEILGQDKMLCLCATKHRQMPAGGHHTYQGGPMRPVGGRAVSPMTQIMTVSALNVSLDPPFL